MQYGEIKNYIHPYGVPEEIFNKYFNGYAKKYPGYYVNANKNKIKTTSEGAVMGTLRAFEIEYKTKGEDYLKKFVSDSVKHDSGTDNSKTSSKNSKRSSDG